jgi:hypothetical protein
MQMIALAHKMKAKKEAELQKKHKQRLDKVHTFYKQRIAEFHSENLIKQVSTQHKHYTSLQEHPLKTSSATPIARIKPISWKDRSSFETQLNLDR